MARIGLLFLVVACSLSALAQTTPTRIRSVTSLPATCNAGNGIIATDFVTLIASSKSTLERCSATDTWTPMMDMSSAYFNFDPVTGVLTLSGPGTSAIYLGEDGNCTWSGPGSGTFLQICDHAGTPTANNNNTGNFDFLLLDNQGKVPGSAANPEPLYCGTTTTCSSTVVAQAVLSFGQVTLSTGTRTVTGISPAYASTSSYQCLANDITTIANGSKAVPASGSSITVTGTGSDVINWICIGN